jgi:hypothetical protein
LNPDLGQNRIFAEFFAAYRKNRVFRPHHCQRGIKISVFS